MRTILASAVTASLLLAAAPAMASNICINTRDIDNSVTEHEGASILFKMRDGTQWRNTLQGRCPDLVFNGFVWKVRNPDGTVCGNEQSLRVLQSGQVCMLGKFEKVSVPPKRG